MVAADLLMIRSFWTLLRALRGAMPDPRVAEAERWRKLREVGVVTRDEDGGLVFVAPLPEPKERPLGIAVSDPDGVEDEINRAFGLPRALRALPATPAPGPSAERCVWCSAHSVRPASLFCSFDCELEAWNAHNTPSPGPSAEDVFGDVRAERAKQDAQWGGPAHDDQHSDWDWLRFIQRHARLAAATPLNEQARYQWVRVAALAVAAIESHDRKVAALTRCPGGQS